MKEMRNFLSINENITVRHRQTQEETIVPLMITATVHLGTDRHIRIGPGMLIGEYALNVENKDMLLLTVLTFKNLKIM